MNFVLDLGLGFDTWHQAVGVKTRQRSWLKTKCKIWFIIHWLLDKVVQYYFRFLIIIPQLARFCTDVSPFFVYYVYALNVCCYANVIVEMSDTHTHPFNSPFSRTTQVGRYQKGKTNLDFTEARDIEWQWHRLGHMQVCTLLQTDNHASTSSLSFLQARCPSCRPTNSAKALKASEMSDNINISLSGVISYLRCQWRTARNCRLRTPACCLLIYQPAKVVCHENVT